MVTTGARQSHMSSRVGQSVSYISLTGLVTHSVMLTEIILCKFSVYIYTEHCIMTVLLQYAILYNNGMNMDT